jgi:hypothetical protein
VFSFSYLIGLHGIKESLHADSQLPRFGRIYRICRYWKRGMSKGKRSRASLGDFSKGAASRLFHQKGCVPRILAPFCRFTFNFGSGMKFP